MDTLGSSSSIVPPIFASSSGDTSPGIYRSVGELESYAEAVDVQNGEWLAYDSVGREIALTVDGDLVRVGAGEYSAPERLAEWLRSSPLLKRRRGEEWLNTAALQDLVIAFDHEGVSWREQLPLTRLRRWLGKLIVR